MKLSIVIPIYNESESIPELFARLKSALSGQPDYEIIAVNDGSKDDSWQKLIEHAGQDSRVKLINFKNNSGQTAALSAGINSARGEVIVPIDSDLENNPNDIPKLLAKLDEGYDVVSGWRQNRWQGQWLKRKLPSKVANWLIGAITGVTLHDYGCTLKAYRRDIISDVKLYGEMHRFIPALAAWNRGRVTEIPVSYQPRQHGVSNYGFSRTFRVLLDLVLIKFLSKYMARPMHFFGGIGFTSFLLGVVAALISIILKLAHSRDFVETPLPVWSALLIIIGVQLIVMGILAEMIMRTYYESQGKTYYSIKEKINF